MSEKKIVVPEGMLKAFGEAYDHQKGLGADRDTRERWGIEAALRWLIENPIVPTEKQYAQLHRDFIDKPDCWGVWAICEWQRRMFLAQEPEVPEAIKDLMWSEAAPDYKEHNEDVIAAYCRGTDRRK